MPISRRDFLKFSSLLTASTFIQPGPQFIPRTLTSDPNAKNVLIIVFDAFSDSNINFYGYPRETMPKLTQLLDRATVYHNHYASSNFTTTGTASLLTGRHPWEHLALKLGYSVKPELFNKNIFTYFEDYYSLAYTHNIFADILLSDFDQGISLHEYYRALFLELDMVGLGGWFTDLVENDIDAGLLFKTRLRDTSLDGYLYSLLFPGLLGPDEFQASPEIAARFPRGLPESGKGRRFLLEDSIDWTIDQSTKIPQPFLGYFHFYPPHYPYNTRVDFIDTFAGDGLETPDKPIHPVVIPNWILTQQQEINFRREYDEFILYVDSEFNRLFNSLAQKGVLDNTLIVFTSDHGEMFERRARGHDDPLLFDPVVKVPLVFFEPGQTERKDIYSPTSCVDLLPTLLQYTGHDIPDELPGQVLPSFSNKSPDPERRIFSMDGRRNFENDHITIATLMMRKDQMKVIRYSNYAEGYRYYGRLDKLEKMQNVSDIYYEVFDLEHDPEELNNLAIQPGLEIQALIDELETYYRENVEFP